MLFAELGTAHSSEQLEAQYDTYLFQRKFTCLKQSAVLIKNFLDSRRADQRLSLAPLKRQLNSTNANLYCLAERLIALDSCRHIWSVVAQAQDFLGQVIPEEQMHFVSNFLAQTKSCIEELDSFITEVQLPKLVRLELVIGQINSLPWVDLGESSSNYVDRLFHVIDDLKQRLNTIGGGSLPVSLQRKVLRSAFVFTCEQLVECYSKAKKSSLAVRQQMQIDLIAFRDTLVEEPNLPSLDGYLEYLQIWKEGPDQILEFMLRRSELPLRLHRALVNTAPQMTPLGGAKRSHLIAKVEEQCRATLAASNFSVTV